MSRLNVNESGSEDLWELFCEDSGIMEDLVGLLGDGYNTIVGCVLKDSKKSILYFDREEELRWISVSDRFEVKSDWHYIGRGIFDLLESRGYVYGK